MSHSEFTALQRKAGAGRPPPEYGVMTPAKGLRLALAHAGNELLDCALVAGTVEESRLSLAQMGDFFGAGALAVLLRGGQGKRGLAVLEPGAVTALIEALTTGRVGDEGPGDPPRLATATDAYLCGGFLTDVLQGFAKQITGLADAAWVAGYSAGEQVSDPRSLPLLLQDIAYRAIAAPVDFDGGKASGTIRFILPPADGAVSAQFALPAPSGRASTQDSVSAQAAAAREVVMAGEVGLEAVLHQFSIPLGKLDAWQLGERLPVPVRAIGAVALRDVAGKEVAFGQLGQAQGHRALRITQEPLAEAGVAPAGLAAPAPEIGLGTPEDSPAMEDLPEVALDAGSMGNLPALGDDAGLGGDLPALDDGGDLPDLPALPALGDESDLPDLPALGGDDGELPDLPDLPALPPLGEEGEDGLPG
ncbi:MAG: FliM/FliN family flagellar motor switch protein, partial [Mangrovicoccus sp.]|nr:FliM/FliN family flagellar motor switch protein [Mangrovicoccus sp.]